jgi:hypothetical protein
VPSGQQYADIMTKGLPTTLCEDFKASLCIRQGDAAKRGEGGVFCDIVLPQSSTYRRTTSRAAIAYLNPSLTIAFAVLRHF